MKKRHRNRLEYRQQILLHMNKGMRNFEDRAHNFVLGKSYISQSTHTHTHIHTPLEFGSPLFYPLYKGQKILLLPLILSLAVSKQLTELI